MAEKGKNTGLQGEPYKPRYTRKICKYTRKRLGKRGKKNELYYTNGGEAEGKSLSNTKDKNSPPETSVNCKKRLNAGQELKGQGRSTNLGGIYTDKRLKETQKQSTKKFDTLGRGQWSSKKNGKKNRGAGSAKIEEAHRQLIEEFTREIAAQIIKKSLLQEMCPRGWEQKMVVFAFGRKENRHRVGPKKKKKNHVPRN